jgi:hypothetical protein
MNSCGCASLWEWLKPSVSFLPPRIVSVCWPSWRIAIVRSNMCSVQRARRKRDVTAAGHYAAIACEAARLHFHGSSSSIFVLG